MGLDVSSSVHFVNVELFYRPPPPPRMQVETLQLRWELSSVLEEIILHSFLTFPVSVEPFSVCYDRVVSPKTNYIFSQNNYIYPKIHING